MKQLVLGVLAIAPLLSAAGSAPAGAQITSTTLQATLRKAPVNSVTDQQIRVIDVGKVNVGVGVVHRSASAAQSAVEHDQLTEVYHILRGSGTLELGGTIVNPKREPATSKVVTELNGPSVRGSALQNAKTYRLAPGDVVVIPAGVGHWFTSVDGSIDYVVVRVDADKVLPAK